MEIRGKVRKHKFDKGLDIRLSKQQNWMLTRVTRFSDNTA